MWYPCIVVLYWTCFHYTFRNDTTNRFIVSFFFSAHVIMNPNNAMHQSMHQSMWRPPYPSENLKTPRIKTCSTTNPYATQGSQATQSIQGSHATQGSHASQATQATQSHEQQLQELKHSKRENNSDKIYERGLTPQVGMNPFLQGNNYIQDLETQNQFLKPLNSNLN